ncbi:MAG: hypothetical protein AAF368_16125, partial [Planctomycetota bacterium]
MLLAFSLRESQGKGRLLAAALAAVSLVGAFLLPISPIVILAPWQRRPPRPTLAIDAPEGLFVVDASASGFPHVRLDGRLLTPRLEDAGLDAAALEATIALLPEEVRSRDLRVLLVGILTPGRAIALGRNATIDRTASFHPLLPDLERALFAVGGYELPASGETLSPKDAEERLAAANYDLVIAPPVLSGPTPRNAFGGLAKGASETTFAFWIDASSSQVGASALGEDSRALLVSDGLERWAIGLVQGPGVRDFGEPVANYGAEPRAIALGAPVDAPPLSLWLSTRAHRKGRVCAELLGARLQRANQETAAGKLSQVLARTTAIQHESSPFADEAASTEIDEQALTLLREAALEQTPDLFTARFIERMGRTLLGKGWIDETHELLEPIAARYAPRPELETI